MASSVADLVQKLDKAAAGIDKAQQNAVNAVSMMAKNVMIEGAESVNTPRRINTSRGKKNNAWGVRYLNFTSRAVPLNTVFFFGGPPYWRERGIKAHEITPRKKRGKTGPLYFNGLFSESASHPGVAARPFWTRTRTAVQARSGEIYKKANTAALVKAGFGI